MSRHLVPGQTRQPAKGSPGTPDPRAPVLPPITYRTFISAPPPQVFEAVATGPGWESWFTTEAAIDPVADGRYTFRWANFGADRVSLELTGRVLVYEPHERFAFEWQSGHDRTQVQLHLEPRADGTVLTVEEHGYGDHEDQVRACLECACGWGEALTLLKFYIEHDVIYGPVPGPPQP